MCKIASNLLEIHKSCAFRPPQPFTEPMFSVGKSKGRGAQHSRNLKIRKTSKFTEMSFDNKYKNMLHFLCKSLTKLIKNCIITLKCEQMMIICDI